MLQINFIMICIIHKISVFLKITRILKMLFKDYSRCLFIYLFIYLFIFNNFFFQQNIKMESRRFEEENIFKDLRSLFRLAESKKETIVTTIKGRRNLFRLDKEKIE